MTARDPVIRTVPIDELRPTQLTIGLIEVEHRRKAWRDAKGKEREQMLVEHLVPAVLGPKQRHYMIDHHHLVRALHEEGAAGVFVQVLHDYSRLARAEFWVMLDSHGWVHTYDADGERVGFDAIPKHIAKLADDPYRSLAGAVRRAGGFAKDATPYVEFMWASFFRTRIAKADIAKDFEGALDDALKLAHGGDADYLPGWCGPSRK
ncbi:MAG: ParB-like protein [Alphaproteobacteria bacterium]